MDFSDAGDWYNNTYQSAAGAAGIDLGNAADALGVNYDESKRTGAAIGGAYVGAGYGAGFSALAGGSGAGAAGAAGSAEMNPTITGAAGYAAEDYMLRPDGTFVKKQGAKYAASDEYGGYDKAKRDWFYNQEQAQQNSGEGLWTKDQFKLAQAQYNDNSQREGRIGAINNWEQSRNPYYASLYQSQVKAAQATNQQGYADSMKRMELQHATRGTSGGSQEGYNSAQLGAAKAIRNSQAAQGIQDNIQGMRRSDQNQAGNMRLSQMSSPYMSALANSMGKQHNAQSQGYTGGANLDMMRNQDEQSYQNGMSQVYGQAIGNAAGGASNFAGG